MTPGQATNSPMNKEGIKIYHKELSYRIVGIIYDVYNELGYGYKEKYYEEAIAHAFDKFGLKFKRQKSN